MSYVVSYKRTREMNSLNDDFAFISSAFFTNENVLFGHVRRCHPNDDRHKVVVSSFFCGVFKNDDMLSGHVQVVSLK